jgi:uncharacterized membrane protein YfcA
VPDPATSTLLLLALAALTAGWVDAVVGGGGLIQLPALVLGIPGASPVQVLATNKLASICGTTVSSTTYFRRVRPDLRTALPLMFVGFLGALAGAVLASRIPKSAFNPMILAVLVLVGAYTYLRPEVGRHTLLRFHGRRHLWTAVVAGLVIGFYDGLLGPGTGSFFVFALVGLLGYSFLDASAKARMANWATNAAALVVFVPQGAVMWKVGLTMGACGTIGAYLGARTAVTQGAGFVRGVFLVVVTGFTLKIGSDVLRAWL